MDGYEQSLHAHVLAAAPAGQLRPLAEMPVGSITRGMLNRLARDLTDRGLKPSTVRNVLMPVRGIFRWLVSDEELDLSPTDGMEVPAGSGRRTRVLTVEEITRLLRALPAGDRALWATAIYGGLRRGELMALRWDDMDLAQCVLNVQQSYDPRRNTVKATKSSAGRRKVPICAELRDHLVEHRARAGARPRGFAFARRWLAGSEHVHRANLDRPFLSPVTGRRAREAAIAAGLHPVTLHDCRHTFASMAIAAMMSAGRLNPKILQEVMGHTSIQITYDRYGHLFPGAEQEIGQILDAFLSSSTPQSGSVADVDEAVAALFAALDGAGRAEVQPLVSQLMAGLGMWMGGEATARCVTFVSGYGR